MFSHAHEPKREKGNTRRHFSTNRKTPHTRNTHVDRQTGARSFTHTLHDTARKEGGEANETKRSRKMGSLLRFFLAHR